MTMSIETFNAADYERRYQKGYGLLYPESHIIRVHRQILEWELQLESGNVFDFGCGAGAHLRYFAERGYVPYGCDTSATAIKQCQHALPYHACNFFVSQISPDLINQVGENSQQVFMSNQVLYFLSNEHIRHIVNQAYQLLTPGGVFIATMMSHSCWYKQYAMDREGDFYRVKLDTPRQRLETLINFKDKQDLEVLFVPFRKLHIGSYSSWIREDEGSTDHWIFVGVRD